LSFQFFPIYSSTIGTSPLIAFRAVGQRIGMATVNESHSHPGHRWMLEALQLAQNALNKQEVPSK
jgi:hypothetical protein